jgi:transposase
MKNLSSKSLRLDVLPMVNYYMDQLALRQLFEKFIPQSSKMILSPADVLSMMVANIIIAPHPLYKFSEWAADYLDGIDEQPLKSEKYNDDCLGRNLDRLFECDRNSLMLELTANAIQAHQLTTDSIHNDSTTITFKGRYESQDPEAAQLCCGHSKDFRPDCLQLVYGLNVTDDGNVPMSFQLFSGNQTDDNTHIPNWDHLRQMLGKTDFIYIADCKLCNEENLDHIDQNGGFFITVVPKNRSILKSFQQQLQNGDVLWQPAFSVQDNRKPSIRHEFHTFEAGLTEKGYRLIWILSSAKAQQEQKTRERRIEKAEAELTELSGKLNRYNLKTSDQINAATTRAIRNTKGLIDVDLITHQTHYTKKIGSGRPGGGSIYKYCTKTTYEIQWRKNQAAIDQQALSDGTFPLITNTDKQCADILSIYKKQAGLEKRFNTTKSILEIAPVFLEKSSRIEAIAFLYFVALMVISLMERAIRKQMAEESIKSLAILPQKMKTARPTWNNMRYLFRNVHISQIFTDNRLISQSMRGLHEIHIEVLRLMGISSSVYLKLVPQHGT